MSAIELVTKDLGMDPKELVKKGLKLYFFHRLANLKTEIFRIAKRYGVNDVLELDASNPKES